LYVGDNPRQMQQHNTIVAITLSMLIVDFWKCYDSSF
jgi:hypothetical protein